MGDSIGLGYGLSAKNTVSEYTVDYLNEALAAPWVEALNMSIVGACMLYYFGRVSNICLGLEPDIVVFLICGNDASFLDYDIKEDAAHGESWSKSRPILESAWELFARRAAAHGNVKFLFTYFYRFREINGISPPAIIGELCSKHGFPFLDLSPYYQELPEDEMIVSARDGHFSEHAHRLAAKHISDFILENGYVSPSADYSDVSWIENISALPKDMAASGNDPGIAALHSRLLLENKWKSAGARAGSLIKDYRKALRRIKNIEEARMEELALRALSAHIRSSADTEWQFVYNYELRINQFNALLYLLNHAAKTGALEFDLNLLPYVKREPADSGPVVLEKLGATIESVSRGISDAIPHLKSWHDYVGRNTKSAGDPDFRYLESFISRLHRSYIELRASLCGLSGVISHYKQDAVSDDAARLMDYFHVFADRVYGNLASMERLLPGETYELTGPMKFNSRWMRLDICVDMDGAGDACTLVIAPEGIHPAYRSLNSSHARIVAGETGQFVSFDIPLFFFGNVNFLFAGAGVDIEWEQNRSPKISSAVLTLPDESARTIDITEGVAVTKCEKDRLHLCVTNIFTI